LGEIATLPVEIETRSEKKPFLLSLNVHSIHYHGARQVE
jgi:hypothetical protein